MTFVPKKYDSGNVLRLPLTASATVTKHNHALMSSGYVAAGSGGEGEAEYISLETTTDSSGTNGDTIVEVLRIDGTEEIHATCATTPVQATHVGNDYDFSSAALLDLTATTDKVFHIDAIVSATDKVVKGHFNKPAIA